MPWSNQNGNGPWGGGNNGGSPWSSGGNDNGGNKSPWEKKPSGSGGNGGNNGPDIDDILRKGQDKLKQFGGAGMFLIVLLFAIIFWLFQCFYVVQQNEQGVVLRFGVPQEGIVGDGLHFHFWPIETYMKVPLTEKSIAIGGKPGQAQQSDGLMLSFMSTFLFIIAYQIQRAICSMSMNRKALFGKLLKALCVKLSVVALLMMFFAIKKKKSLTALRQLSSQPWINISLASR